MQRSDLLSAIRKAFRWYPPDRCGYGVESSRYNPTDERIRRAKRMTARDRSLVLGTAGAAGAPKPDTQDEK